MRRGAAGAAALAVALLLAACTATSPAPSGTAASRGGQVVPAGPVAGAATVQPAPATIADDSGIDGVLAWDVTSDAQHRHVPGPVTYAVTPPIGGPHDAIWMNAGVYTAPIPSERAVHNMEHGAVWITYRPDLPAAQVAQLRALVDRQSLIAEPTVATGQANRYVDLSPWADGTLPAAVVVSSWGHQLRVDSPDDPRIQRFIDTFRVSKTYTPEYGAPVDGVPTGTGGVPAADGGAVANPAGTYPG